MGKHWTMTADHAAHAAKNPPRAGYTCGAHAETYGGGCFNCGWKPDGAISVSGPTTPPADLPTLLYGPTTSDSGDGSCESCGERITWRDDCYVFGIGGGVAQACYACGQRMLAEGAAVLDSAVRS